MCTALLSHRLTKVPFVNVRFYAVFGFFTETMFASKHKSTKCNNCCQVFASDKGCIAVHPMKSQDELDTALHCFCKEFCAPVDLILGRFST